MDKDFSRYQDELDWMRETGQLIQLSKRAAVEHSHMRGTAPPAVRLSEGLCQACGRPFLDKSIEDGAIKYVHWYYDWDREAYLVHILRPTEAGEDLVIVTCNCLAMSRAHAHVDDEGRRYKIA